MSMIESSRKRRPFGRLLGVSGLHLVLVAISLAMILPFLWMVTTSLKTLDEVSSPGLPQ